VRGVDFVSRVESARQIKERFQLGAQFGMAAHEFSRSRNAAAGNCLPIAVQGIAQRQAVRPRPGAGRLQVAEQRLYQRPCAFQCRGGFVAHAKQESKSHARGAAQGDYESQHIGRQEVADSIPGRPRG
jgi:hypothetical protein